MLARHFVEKNPYLYAEGRGNYYKLSSRNLGQQNRYKILIILSVGEGWGITLGKVRLGYF